MEKGVLYPVSELKNLDLGEVEMVVKRRKDESIYYYNIPCSYDIETSSFRDMMGRPTAITYAHAINIDGYVFKMEHWSELKDALDFISEMLWTDRTNRLIIYVHNLAYEFQFMKKHFEFDSIMANGGDRKIMTALTTKGIEFRCSYMLAGGSLSNVAKNLVKYKIKKMNGDLDYSKIRTPLTPLTEAEEGYILNDVVIIEYFIREAIEENGNIAKIPLTNTGYVRNYCRSLTIVGRDKENVMYRALMKDLTLEVDEYLALRSAFGGGYTHANIEHVGHVKENVTARDFASSYPGRMIAYQYPMGKGEEYNAIDKQDFFNQLDSYCCLFYIRLEGLVRNANEAYISFGKTISSSNVTINNGRVETAEYVELWITDVDFECIQMSYEIDDFKVGTMYRYKRGYLPTPFIKSVLKLYNDKTKLKGLDDMVAEYVRSKGMLNSTYGMAVMDIVQDSFEWDDRHKTNEKVVNDIHEMIEANNNSKKRFLFYAWGVWITAYARYDLFQDVVKLGSDYVYCDTDSIYYTNDDDNKHIFEQSNERIVSLLKQACDHHGFDYDELQPMDKNGERHMIGVWDLDGVYKKFKTLGAKRYMVQKDNGKINITVSGVNKSTAVPYLKDTYGEGIWDAFDENLHVPEGHCGKSTHTYIEDSRTGIVTDYNGVEYEYEELSAIHLEETSYTMTISNEYREMIEWVQGQSL